MCERSVFSLLAYFVRILQFPLSRYLLCVLDFNSTLGKWFLHNILESGSVSGIFGHL